MNGSTIRVMKNTAFIFIAMLCIALLSGPFVQHAHAVEQSSNAKQFVVALDPGHGGYDSGASAFGVNEKDVNWKIAQYCKAELEQFAGVRVYITRKENECPDLGERVKRAAENGANIFVSLHINSAENEAAKGFEVYYPNSSSYKNELSKEGEKLAKCILEKLDELGLVNRGIKVRNSHSSTYPDGSTSDYYGVIRQARINSMPGIIVEHCFISNEDDNLLLRDDAFLRKLAIADAGGIAEAYNLTRGGWERQDDGSWKFRLKDGELITKQWQSLGAWYYFDEDGRAVSGWQKIDNVWYLFGDEKDCSMKEGWQKVNGNWYFLDFSSGAMATGLRTIGKKTYYFGEAGDGSMRSGWQKVDGDWYLFNDKNDGSAKKGWQKVNGNWYYFDPDSCAMINGLKEVNGRTYYFGDPDDGSMKSGWQKVDGDWYLFNDKNDGSAKKGWQKVNGNWYYFDLESCTMTSGLKKINGKVYYFGESDDGAMKTGWQTVKGKLCLFGGEDDGSLLQGDIALDKNEDEQLMAGWHEENGSWFYVDPENREKVSGWLNIKDTWYYLSPDTYLMATGWLDLRGTWYYLGAPNDGAMKTGWQSIGGKWYYLGDAGDGSMKEGWQSIGGKWYYLLPGSGAMVTGQCKIEGAYHFFDDSGVWVGEGSPIMGAPQVSVDRMVAGYNKSHRTYPSEALSKGGAADIEQFCQILYEEAVAEGVRPEVLWAQIMNETGFLQYGGDVKIEQFNFGGLGATGGGVSGASFKDVREGLRAQVQHLKCYASNEPLNNDRVDPRWSNSLRGKAIYIQWLGIPDNPYGTGWASGKGYGINLINQYMDPYLGVR